MTHRSDVARSRDIFARWCDLAEQRLDYLTELFETGRWRRYHSELAFLENIQEAKSAVEIWRDLAMHEAARGHAAVDMSRLGRASLPRGESQVLTAAETEHVFSDDAPSAPAMDHVPELMMDIDAIGQRYPLLRNAL